MSNPRSQLVPLIQELQGACRRPLFTEICLDESTHIQEAEPKDKTVESANIKPPETSSLPPLAYSSAAIVAERKVPKKSWRQLVIEATQLLPYMVEKEFGDVSHLISILLLGFLLPHSTGNEYFLLQYTPDYRKNKEQEEAIVKDRVLEYILHMDLEERLESTCRHHASFEFGEFDTLTDANWELAFDSFLKEGLAPFLGSRPAHLHKVDLLHILAMTIHPQPLQSSIPETANSLQDKHYWKYALKLMTNRHSHSFHANYGHRLKLVKLLVQDLVLPAYDPDLPLINCPLYDGALPHLRSSLHAFAMCAVSLEDAHWARSALVTIAIQSRIEVVMKEEWEYLINRMVEDRTRYPGCKCCPLMLQETPLALVCKPTSKRSSTNATFCPHAGRGQHLADFLTRTCQARRHHSAHGDYFLNEAFSSLTDAIEWQTHCWKQDGDSEPSDSEETPCMLASLLFAAKYFFYFLLPAEDKQGADQDDNHSDVMMRRDELVSCAIQLCHHFDSNIAGQAAELVSLAFAYGSKKTTEESAQPLCLSLRMSIAALIPKDPPKSDLAKLESNLLQSSLQNVISAASRRSPSFALSFLNMLLEQGDVMIAAGGSAKGVDKDGDVSMKDASESDNCGKSAPGHFMLRLLASISLSNPVVAGQKVEALTQLLEKLESHASRLQVIAAILATRQSHFFLTEKDPSEACVLSAMGQISDRWSLYQVGRLALRTGNFAAAHQCYKKILASTLSERYFIWVSTLAQISDAECCLTKHAARGIPSATTKMRSALSTLVSLDALDRSQDSDFNFQINFVNLRLDFLDLLTALRQLIREMRLTGTAPAKRTRSFLHFQNITRCFDALARRYWFLYRQYGLFSCQQTRTTLRTLYAVCRFMARSVRVVFSDSHLANKKEEKRPPLEPTGDVSCPVSRFLQRLEEGLLPKMNPAIETVIRAAAMLEVVDGMLLCPVPFPVGFLAVSALPKATLQLSVDPEQQQATSSNNEGNRIDCYPGISFEFYASGEIPQSVIAKSQLPFTTVLLWHRADYVGPLQEDEHLEKQEDEHMADETKEEEAATTTPPKVIPRPWNYTLVSTSLLRNGNFNVKVECPILREEGNYVIEVKLGCRDIRGGEWELPIVCREGGREYADKLDVQVSRSNWHA